MTREEKTNEMKPFTINKSRNDSIFHLRLDEFKFSFQFQYHAPSSSLFSLCFNVDEKWIWIFSYNNSWSWFNWKYELISMLLYHFVIAFPLLLVNSDAVFLFLLAFSLLWTTDIFISRLAPHRAELFSICDNVSICDTQRNYNFNLNHSVMLPNCCYAWRRASDKNIFLVKTWLKFMEAKSFIEHCRSAFIRFGW